MKEDNDMATRILKGQEPKAAKPSKPKILVFGKPGVGKTWAALDFPSVYYVDTEGGANLEHYTAKLHASGGRYFGPEQGSLDFPTVIEEIVTLATIQHPYRTLVIDSFSKLFNTTYAATTERMERQGEKIAFANDKKEALGMTRRLVRWIDKLDMNTILICHEKDKWSNGEIVGQTFDGWDKLEYELHLSLRIEKQAANRIARVQKTRLEQFPDASVFPWSFAEFAKRFGQSVMETASAPIAVASEEQVRQVQELIELLKIPSEQTDKWLELGGADSWREMPADKVAKTIETLTKRLPQRAA